MIAESARDLACSGTRGHHIIHNETRTLNRLAALKSAAYVLNALVTGQARLADCGSGASNEVFPDFKTEPAGEKSGLIVAPLALPASVQWHRHDIVRGEGGLPQTLRQTSAEWSGQRDPVVVFELMNDSPQRIVKDKGSPDEIDIHPAGKTRCTECVSLG